jgi:glycosyltransferase involved in cell wall biosynthesis
LNSGTPLVTIGIPNFNYAHYIEEALNSVASQTYPNIEMIIVDDCSADNSVAVIENWIQNYSGRFVISFIKN